jgi:hypothetical protein
VDYDSPQAKSDAEEFCFAVQQTLEKYFVLLLYEGKTLIFKT